MYKKLNACLLVLLSILPSLRSQDAAANGLNVGAGYDFVPGAGYVAAGYRRGLWDFEASLLRMGKEEPTTRPGPEMSLNVLGYLPAYPVFLKAGVVTGWQKSGYDFGAGVDVPLGDRWSGRLQVTHDTAREDLGAKTESETLLSVGLKYDF
ncbi:MAG: hypothetical protein HKM03_00760 [Steroidobacteraceae bacterium]|nr:hypothetical protein [Steroidobacteraceae bacterium]